MFNFKDAQSAADLFIISFAASQAAIQVLGYSDIIRHDEHCEPGRLLNAMTSLDELKAQAKIATAHHANN